MLAIRAIGPRPAAGALGTGSSAGSNQGCSALTRRLARGKTGLVPASGESACDRLAQSAHAAVPRGRLHERSHARAGCPSC